MFVGCLFSIGACDPSVQYLVSRWGRNVSCVMKMVQFCQDAVFCEVLLWVLLALKLLAKYMWKSAILGLHYTWKCSIWICTCNENLLCNFFGNFHKYQCLIGGLHVGCNGCSKCYVTGPTLNPFLLVLVARQSSLHTVWPVGKLCNETTTATSEHYVHVCVVHSDHHQKLSSLIFLPCYKLFFHA